MGQLWAGAEPESSPSLGPAWLFLPCPLHWGQTALQLLMVHPKNVPPSVSVRGPISIFHLHPGRPEGSPHPHGCLQCQPRLSSILPLVPADVKFDAVSGDYYPIIYFNDYWNLQKDYYPINESLASLPLRVSFCPLSLWRWQLYAAQSTKSPWNFLGDELYEQSDEEQDSVKVRPAPGASQHPPGLREGKGK